ncbi:alpha/beta hydrolase [Dactylosporangium sp. NPDC000244]|uniref:alpha/beta fold hydrolase n=1 Tax=Dactylosporangium sp. NPDC000244 TaxID=3154365 RepID=UPI0033297749
MNAHLPAAAEPRRHRLPGAVLNCSVTGAGPAVLLLHGWPQTRYAWRFVQPLLEQHYTVVVPDLPGFGASARLPGGYDKKSVAAILHALMSHLGFATFHVVGHDVGGQIAYPLAACYPASVSSLIFVEAGIPGLGHSERAANPLLGGSWHFGFNMLDDLPELLLAGRERPYLEYLFRRDTIGLFVTEAIGDADLDVYARALAGPGAVRATMGYYRSLPADIEDNRALCRNAPLAMPVTVVGARYGIGLGWLDSVREAAPAVSSHLIEDSGHYVPEEQPEQLVSLIGTTIAELP